MAKNYPGQEPDIDSEELSEKELERKRRQEARREAKRQQQELKRIEKQMKEPMSKWVWISIGVIIVLLVLLSWGGYLFWGSYTINLQRKSFMDNYNVAELTRLRRYAPEQLKRVEELKETAANANSALTHQEVVDTYRKADEALAAAQATAERNASAYETALKRFRILREEALEHKLNTYATLLWKRVDEAESAAVGQDARDFSATLAIEKLNQANDALRKASESYGDLKAFDAAYLAFTFMSESVSTVECAKNAPNDWANVQTSITRAEAARESGNWELATRLYREATQTITPIKEKVETLKNEARDQLAVMEQALETARSKNMPRQKPDVWKRIETAAASAREAFAASDYRKTRKDAEQVIALLGEVGASAEKTKQTLVSLLEEINALHRKAREDDAFFSRNYRDVWRQIRQRVADLPDLVRSESTIDMVALAKALRDDLQKLLKQRTQVFEDLIAARKTLEETAKAPLFKDLEANYPQESRRIADLQQTARRRQEARDMREARDLLQQAAANADKLLSTLSEDRSTALRLRAELRERRRQFAEGIRRFLAPETTALRQRSERLDDLIDRNLYRPALDLARELERILPDSRYQPRDDGTVLDFERGIMWIADGASPAGGNSGRKMDWYTALNWADSLVYAGTRDWRLPNAEELRDLHRLAENQRKTLFPNTVEAMHWTNLPSQDVGKALAVDVGTGRMSREDKQDAFHVRAVSEAGSR